MLVGTAITGPRTSPPTTDAVRVMHYYKALWDELTRDPVKAAAP